MSGRESRQLLSTRLRVGRSMTPTVGKVSRFLSPRGPSGARELVRPLLEPERTRRELEERFVVVPQKEARTIARRLVPPSPAAKKSTRSLKRKTEHGAARPKSSREKGFLESHVGQKVTMLGYARTMRMLVLFMIMFGIDLEAVTPPPGVAETLDLALVEWSDQEYFEGEGASTGDKTWAALVDWWPQFGPRVLCTSLVSSEAARLGGAWLVAAAEMDCPGVTCASSCSASWSMGKRRQL